jgi:hypothetical protein
MLSPLLLYYKKSKTCTKPNTTDPTTGTYFNTIIPLEDDITGSSGFLAGEAKKETKRSHLFTLVWSGKSGTSTWYSSSFERKNGSFLKGS